jgi:hypothetical protein
MECVSKKTIKLQGQNLDVLILGGECQYKVMTLQDAKFYEFDPKTLLPYFEYTFYLVCGAFLMGRMIGSLVDLVRKS